eukprot:TRINITY_DN608_c0_g1_i1.p1 TRINITY_DN608_c0_g1~~TRINITY_DN608_c0_g1_i1.p1  ORF type:complete len:344 (+),score=130.91 TRINITY_DN608_c0_g1_i1:929-1960(+)
MNAKNSDMSDVEIEKDASQVLWIGNIGPQVMERELREEFGEFGNITGLRILRDRYCAFITFETVFEAVVAKRELNGQIFGNQYIVINFRQADKNVHTDITVTNPPSNSLWVGNISEGVNKQDLLKEFGSFGHIESIRILRNCAFVNFQTVEQAATALDHLQGRQLGDMNIKINYGKSRPVPPPTSDENNLDPEALDSLEDDENIFNNDDNNNKGNFQGNSDVPAFHNNNQNSKLNNQQYQMNQNFSNQQDNQHNNKDYSWNGNNNIQQQQQQQFPPQPYCDHCKKNLKGVRLIPCNHVLCSECVDKLRWSTVCKKDKGTKCPFCKEVISNYQPFNINKYSMKV